MKTTVVEIYCTSKELNRLKKVIKDAGFNVIEQYLCEYDWIVTLDTKDNLVASDWIPANQPDGIGTSK